MVWSLKESSHFSEGINEADESFQHLQIKRTGFADLDNALMYDATLPEKELSQQLRMGWVRCL